jgi:hypothetical protein
MKVHGVVQTEPGRKREDVFQAIERPSCRFVLMNNPSILSLGVVGLRDAKGPKSGLNAVGEWRKSAFLADKYRATRRIWEVAISLLPGIALSEDGGMTPSRAEEAAKAFLNGDERYSGVVEDLLEQSVGITLKLPGDLTAVLVAEAYFESCVEIGESRLVSELPILVF